MKVVIDRSANVTGINFRNTPFVNAGSGFRLSKFFFVHVPRLRNQPLLAIQNVPSISFICLGFANRRLIIL